MSDLGTWDPLHPDEVTDLLAGLDRPWWIAGGWALDLFLGEQTRPHEDVDVLVLRRDLPVVRRHLAAWDLHAADPPGTLRPWPVDEVLPQRVHDVWCRPEAGSPWRLQLMVDDTDPDDDGEWVYRRDPRVRRPVASLDGPATDARRRVLAPEVQLLQKSKAPRPKDEADLAAVLGRLDGVRRGWLADTLAVVSPRHPWLAAVQSGQ